MRAWLFGAGLIAACSFDPSGIGDDGDDVAPSFDAGPDAPCLDGLGFQPDNVSPCAIPPPGGSWTVATGVKTIIDTTAGTVESDGQPVVLSSALIDQVDGTFPAMVIAVDELVVPDGAEVRVTGTRPLVIVALEAITIAGVLDASGDGPASGGGGGLSCGPSAGDSGTTQIAENERPGGTGGGGGAYATGGGNGGRVSPVVDGQLPTPGGEARVDDLLSPLRGGCQGGAGGVASPSQTAAIGGGAGGAVQLVAGAQITITGVLSASGGGGEGALADAGGGGGGGSGGAILVQTLNLTISGGSVTSLGGGGGEGRRDLGTDAGDHGDDGHTADAQPASGGSGAAGGNGGAGAVADGEGGNGEAGVGGDDRTAGGGGGGGAVGRIHFHLRDDAVLGSGEVISPAATLALDL